MFRRQGFSYSLEICFWCGETWKECVRDPPVTVQVDMRTPCGRMEFSERLIKRAVDIAWLHFVSGIRN